jgi:Mg-chelatase subunit ChlD
MTLAQPFWLAVAIPLAMLLWLRPLPTRLLIILRCLVFGLVLLALCGLSVRLPVRSGTLVLAADRSLSMPPGRDAQHAEAARLVQDAAQPGDRTAVVAFGESVAVEQPPQHAAFSGFTAEVGGDASHLADAVDTSLSLIGKDNPGRILILSDGRATGRDLAPVAARAAASGIALDYRLLERPSAGDLAIESVQGPESALPNESFMLTAWVRTPRAQDVTYELLRGTAVIARGKQAMPVGSNRLLFRDTAPGSGVQQYRLRVTGEGKDPIPENNTSRLLVGVGGAKPILCVSPRGSSGLAALLRQGGLDVQDVAADEGDWSLERLAGCSAVILENTPADRLGYIGMQNLAAWVTDGGGGLMLTGGRDSYGPGGYYKSPLEPILPVSLELRREHRKLALAVVVVLDRSGSMAMSAGGGRTKMDLANLATAEVVEMLGPLDQFGCIAVDSMPHTIVPLTEVEQKGSIKGRVLKIDSLGGGIYVYEGLAAGADMIAPATAGAKHIILFSDAADSENPAGYKKLVGQCAKAGITISVVGLGTEKDVDADLLKDIARRGKGQCMFTTVPEELPRLFAQDMFLVARSAFLEGPIAVKPTGGLTALTRKSLGEFPPIGGYNLCYLRPDANPAVLSLDEYKAPVLASWQAGLGRVLCYTGEADGEYTGPIAGWENAGTFFTSAARWTAGAEDAFGPNIATVQQLRDGVCRVDVHLDPDRDAPPFEQPPELTALIGRPGQAAESRKIGVRWSGADMLTAEIPLTGDETVLPALTIPELGSRSLAPVCLPYSPEYRPAAQGAGAQLLAAAARATGGVNRLDLGEIWQDIPRAPRLVSLAPYLLGASLVLFLLEVVERRTALLSGGGGAIRRTVGSVVRRRKPAVAPAKKPTASADQRSSKLGRRKPSPPAEQPPPTADTQEPSRAPEEDAAATQAEPPRQSLSNTLKAARRRAEQRTKRTDK